MTELRALGMGMCPGETAHSHGKGGIVCDLVFEEAVTFQMNRSYLSSKHKQS